MTVQNALAYSHNADTLVIALDPVADTKPTKMSKGKRT